ncbi:MAG: LPS-assembly protein LptD [Pirellulaceae bacterium]|nr:LPS-assembly protein LptD [Pirellulaceae bacterium]
MRRQQRPCIGLIAARLASILLVGILTCNDVAAQDLGNLHFGHPDAGDTRVAAPPAASELIRVGGDTVFRWQLGDAQASLFEGNCTLEHNQTRMECKSVLMVCDGSAGNVRTRVVIAGHRQPSQLVTQSAQPLVRTFVTADEPVIVNNPRYRGPPREPPQLLRYLPELSDIGSAPSLVRPVQFQSDVPLNPPGLDSVGTGAGDPTGAAALSGMLEAPILIQAPATTIAQGLTPPQQGLIVDTPPPPPTTFPDGATTGGWYFSVGGGSRSVEILARSTSMPPQITTMNRPESNETVVAARGGVTVLVRDVSAQMPDGRLLELGTVSLSADRIVAWMPTFADILRDNNSLSQADGELYLEGDIVFRQGNRIIYADSMYYNVSQERGVVLDAEAIMTVPEYEGIVRLKADVMQQISRGDFVAFDAAITSSRLGVPRYWLQSQQLRLQDRQRIIADPRTGQPIVDSEPFASSNNNFVYFGGVPILYWPRFSATLEYPTFYLTGVKIKDDNTFGTQVLLDWNVFQLLGFENAPKGIDWDLSTDYLSDRGPAVGTKLEYNLPGLFGVPGPVNGLFDTWIIQDTGTDRLGLDRMKLTPEKTTRGRSLLRHRHYLPNDYELIAELGWVSDRNFLEQYLESEWDQEKDHESSIRLRRYLNSNMIDLSAQVQLNDFFTETEELPSLEHYLIGGSLGRWFTWSAHNKVSYSKLNVAKDPIDPVEAAEYSPLPGETERRGIIAATRQELAMPIPLGPVKFVPYISGEASHYGEATDGNSLTRMLGQTGVRASLPMVKSDPTIQSSLMNVRGLAHKMEWTAEYFYAQSDTNLDELPLYDPLDDNSQEQFRRRFIDDTFMGTLPSQFDPRTYAFRHGIQQNIASGSDVIADDLEQFRVGLHQRWQTKRGLPGRERIVDLFQFDTDLMLFPDADRDNFGETVGPATYDMRYHIGDRFTILSDGYFDFFTDGLRSVSAGVRTSRPGVGDWYVGLLSLEGPISSTVLRTSTDFRVNEKWILSGGTTYDFGRTGNIGQQFGITRIGESLLVRLGLNVDTGRDNVGVGFSLEPRFWPSKKLGRLGGQLIPPPGADGLE